MFLFISVLILVVTVNSNPEPSQVPSVSPGPESTTDNPAPQRDEGESQVKTKGSVLVFKREDETTLEMTTAAAETTAAVTTVAATTTIAATTVSGGTTTIAVKTTVASTAVSGGTTLAATTVAGETTSVASDGTVASTTTAMPSSIAAGESTSAFTTSATKTSSSVVSVQKDSTTVIPSVSAANVQSLPASTVGQLQIAQTQSPSRDNIIATYQVNVDIVAHAQPTSGSQPAVAVPSVTKPQPTTQAPAQPPQGITQPPAQGTSQPSAQAATPSAVVQILSAPTTVVQQADAATTLPAAETALSTTAVVVEGTASVQDDANDSHTSTQWTDASPQATSSESVSSSATSVTTLISKSSTHKKIQKKMGTSTPVPRFKMKKKGKKIGVKGRKQKGNFRKKQKWKPKFRSTTAPSAVTSTIGNTAQGVQSTTMGTTLELGVTTESSKTTTEPDAETTTLETTTLTPITDESEVTRESGGTTTEPDAETTTLETTTLTPITEESEVTTESGETTITTGTDETTLATSVSTDETAQSTSFSEDISATQLPTKSSASPKKQNKSKGKNGPGQWRNKGTTPHPGHKQVPGKKKIKKIKGNTAGSLNNNKSKQTNKHESNNGTKLTGSPEDTLGKLEGQYKNNTQDTNGVTREWSVTSTSTTISSTITTTAATIASLMTVSAEPQGTKESLYEYDRTTAASDIGAGGQTGDKSKVTIEAGHYKVSMEHDVLDMITDFFNKLDDNADDVIDTSEMAEQWEQLDVDGDGLLSGEEVHGKLTWFELYALDVDGDGIATNLEFERACKSLDLDGNGKVELNEFIVMTGLIRSQNMDAHNTYRR